jgi:uncharacterized OB-fold protein
VETEPFWSAAAEGRLLLRRCVDCGGVIWYPRAFCPICASLNTEWFGASGRGRVYTFTIIRKGDGPYRGSPPYVLAYVELDEGPRVLTNIVGTEPDQVAIGMPVTAVFDATGQGSALVRFAPA